MSAKVRFPSNNLQVESSLLYSPLSRYSWTLSRDYLRSFIYIISIYAYLDFESVPFILFASVDTNVADLVGGLPRFGLETGLLTGFPGLEVWVVLVGEKLDSKVWVGFQINL